MFRFIFFGVLALSLGLLWQLRGNALNTAGMSAFYRDYFARILPSEAHELAYLEERTRQRALAYEKMISDEHLDHGMVVNREADGDRSDECDSLLFSSLRYVALKKMGLDADADAAWGAIRASRSGGKWFRHPQCAHKSTSRDMIIGVLAALTQRPEGYREMLSELMVYLGEHGGYVGDGPFYVSYLSPGLAEILRHFARLEGIPDDELPPVVRYGFSTMELDTYMSRIGFQSHLLALVLWIEQELKRIEVAEAKHGEEVRALPLTLERFTRALWGVKVGEQRWPWLAQRLVDRDAKNLFFRWLRLSAADALSSRARLVMLRELDAMQQFPESRLPDSCDRRADYMWQRSSGEYAARSKGVCLRRFSGVDYLWMASLLTAADYRRSSDGHTASTERPRAFFGYMP
jgi:hypothetical protein